MTPAFVRKCAGLFSRIRTRLNRFRYSDQFLAAPGVRLLEHASVTNSFGRPANIRIGEGSVLLGHLCTFLPEATISIGSNSYIGPDTRIMAFSRIEIGSRVQIAHDVNLYDSNSHSISASERHIHMREILSAGNPPQTPGVSSEAIIVEDDAWIGFGSAIMKGVRIGRGAIVGACSVVTKDVAPYTIVVGNPQRVVGASTE